MYTARMVVGSKSEEQLLSMTRKPVETELLKVPAHKDFKRFNTHLAKTPAEWAAMEKQLKKVETWPKDKRECCAWHCPWLPCGLVLCLQLSSTLSLTCGGRG